MLNEDYIFLDVKVTNKNQLLGFITEEEAKEAAFVIVASDQKILGMERFEGKPVIRIDITTCIKAPEAVIKKCVQATQK